MATEAQIEAAARAICRARDLNPDTMHQAMPGDGWDDLPEDGHFFNSIGERCKLVAAWRKYVSVATIALTAAEEAV
jgi:hypothetical protein